MSATQHTPGPWVARQFTTGSRFDWIVEAPGTDEIGYSSGIPARIARIEGLDFNNDEPFRYLKEERDEANARLISAAPETAAERDRLRESNAELLEACRQAVFAIPTTHGAFQTVRAAIAKAQAIHTDTISAPDTLDGLRLTPKGRRQLVIAAGMVNADLLAACRLMTEADVSAADMERGLTTPQANRISRAVSAALAAIAKAKGGAS